MRSIKPQHVQTTSTTTSVLCNDLQINANKDITDFVHNRSVIDSIIRLNEIGIICMRQQHESDLSQAAKYFQESLLRAKEATTSFDLCSSTCWNECICKAFAQLDERSHQVNRNNVIEYDEGMNPYSEPISFTMTTKFDKDYDFKYLTMRIIPIILFNSGVLFTRMNLVEEALIFFINSLNTLQHYHLDSSICCGKHTTKVEREETLSVITVLRNIGYLQYRIGHHVQAQETYLNAVEFLRLDTMQSSNSSTKNCSTSSSSSYMIELAATLNSIGILYIRCPTAGNNSDRALQVCFESLSILKGIVNYHSTPHYDQQMANVLNNIGRIYYYQEKLEQAEAMYTASLKLRKRLFGNNHVDVAATIFNLGQTHHKLCNLNEALEFYHEFINIANQGDVLKKGAHCEVITVLKSMGQIYHQRKDYYQATQFYNEAIKIGKSVSLIRGEEYGCELFPVYNHLGGLLFEIKDYQGSMKAYKELLVLERRILDPCHPNIAVTLTNLGQVHEMLGDYSTAIRLHTEAISIRSHLCGHKNDPKIANMLSSISSAHFQLGAYFDAFFALQDACEIWRYLSEADSANTDHSLHVASTLNDIGSVMLKIGSYEDAIDKFLESLRIQLPLLGDQHHQIAITMNQIAIAYFEIGDNEQSLKYYHSSLRIRLNDLNCSQEDVISTLQQMSCIYRRQGDLNEAMKYLRDALYICELELVKNRKQNGHDHDDNHCTYYESMSNVLNEIGNIYFQRGQAKDSVAAFSGALRFLRMAGCQRDDELLLLSIDGHEFYDLSKLHPECAPCA